MTFSALDIAIKLIQCPSVTPEDAGAQVYLKDLLTSHGFDIYDLPFEGRGSYRVENFFARYGTGAPHLCFAGHTDVVPAGDEAAWSVPPFAGTVKDGKLIGRGSSDMKGDDAAFIAATLKYLKDNPGFTGSISFLITGDEEKDAVNGTARVLEWMKEHGHIPDACLVAEPSNPDYMGQSIRIGRRGSLSGTLTLHGTQGHVAYPEKADNPLPRLIQCLDALNDITFDSGSGFFPPTNLEVTSIDVANKADNVIPAKGAAQFNIRFSDQWDFESLEERLHTALRGVCDDYDVVFKRGARSFLTQPGAWTNLVVKAVETVMGKTPEMNAGGGSSDARFVAQYCDVVECGMVSKTIHQVDEYCTLEELEQCESIYREILKLYFA